MEVLARVIARRSGQTPPAAKEGEAHGHGGWGFTQMAMVQSRFGILFWLVGEFTTHFRTYCSGWIGMVTGGTIWTLYETCETWLELVLKLVDICVKLVKLGRKINQGLFVF